MPENISVPYSFRKEGIYYFARRVPKPLIAKYGTAKISYSLRTRSAKVARKRALAEAVRLDEYWYQQRICLSPVKLPSTVPTGRQAFELSDPEEIEGMSVEAALDVYLRLKGRGKSQTSIRSVERPFEYLSKACGDKPLNHYNKADAVSFRDYLIARGLSGSSIARNFGTVRAVFNLAMSEGGLIVSNPFSGVYIDREAGVIERQPIPLADIRTIQSTCREIDDDLRWLIAMLSDTGMRLAEAAGLHADDLVLSGIDIPYVRVRNHPWRRLKTKGSERVVPLVGASLWASERVLESSNESVYAFPRYNTGETTNANSASAALNKWSKGFVPVGCSLHSFRHSIRDRLRAVGCPEEVADQLGGWSKRSIGQNYGLGYNLEALSPWMGKIS